MLSSVLKDAQREVSALNIMGCPERIMRHAFFADMGSFMLYLRDSQQFSMIYEHTQWLVTYRFLEFSKVMKEDI